MRPRERRILEVITAEPIHTQTQLVRALRATGMRISQATMSRDIRRLGLVKTPTADGRARYLPPAEVLPVGPDAERRLARALRDYATGVDEGSGLLLMKTTTGSAMTVAEAIDEVQWPDVAGTIAGDNTILIVPRSSRRRPALRRRLESLLR